MLVYAVIRQSQHINQRCLSLPLSMTY